MAMFLSPGSRINDIPPGQGYKLELVRNKDNITYASEDTYSINVTSSTSQYSSLTADDFIFTITQGGQSTSTQGTYRGSYTVSATYVPPLKNYNSETGTLVAYGMYGQGTNGYTPRFITPAYKVYLKRPINSSEQGDTIIKIGEQLSGTNVTIDVKNFYSEYQNLTYANFIMDFIRLQGSKSASKSVSMSGNSYVKAFISGTVNSYNSSTGILSISSVTRGGFYDTTKDAIVYPDYDVYLWIPNNS